MTINYSKFITFEGGEGSGKSTQARLLYEAMRNNNIAAILTREPGGSKKAEMIRELLINNKLDARAELLMIMAARIDHLENTINPALNEGKFVICDRYLDSTIAYQGYGMGLGSELVIKLHEELMPNAYPGRTFYLYMDPQAAMERAINRGDSNKYEKLGDKFHKKVAKAFEILSNEYSERYIKLYANCQIGEIHEKILEHVGKIYGVRFEKAKISKIVKLSN